MEILPMPVDTDPNCDEAKRFDLDKTLAFTRSMGMDDEIFFTLMKQVADDNLSKDLRDFVYKYVEDREHGR